MFGKFLKEKAKKLQLRQGSKYELIRSLIVSGFFDDPKTTKKLIDEIRQDYGKKLKTIEIQTYMKKFMNIGVIRAVKLPDHKGNFWVLANVTKEDVLRSVTGDKQVLKIEEELFSEGLTKKLKRDFQVEFNDLRHNFGKSGTCTAFLLRKVLEKLIFLAFAKNGRGLKLEDKTRPSGLVGLETMINIASGEKVHGIPFLISKTARELKGIKFLGDTSAHNPLTNVDMRTIILHMPFIITAYEELSRKL